MTVKGEEFVKKIPAEKTIDSKLIKSVESLNRSAETLLAEANKGLPDYKKDRQEDSRIKNGYLGKIFIPVCFLWCLCNYMSYMYMLPPDR